MKNYVTINGKDYKVPEVDFDAICQLEENGVYLLNMDPNERKIGTMIRAIVAWVMGVDNATASAELSEHIRNGGNIMEIANAVTEAIGDAGFFSRKPRGEVQEFQPNREQRRRKNRSGNKGYTNHSQRS